MNTLPDRIFFTGVPGSRWSGIAQTIETLPGFNTSDRSSEREYSHNQYSGHLGAYFGYKMELEPILKAEYIDAAWQNTKACRLIKSHDWAYMLEDIKLEFPNDWIMMVYRPDMASYAWWHQAGGFTIKYPNYSWYENSSVMLGRIAEQNNKILEFGFKKNLQWSYFTSQWIEETFKERIKVDKQWTDILVTILK